MTFQIYTTTMTNVNETSMVARLLAFITCGSLRWKKNYTCNFLFIILPLCFAYRDFNLLIWRMVVQCPLNLIPVSMVAHFSSAPALTILSWFSDQSLRVRCANVFSRLFFLSCDGCVYREKQKQAKQAKGSDCTPRDRAGQRRGSTQEAGGQRCCPKASDEPVGPEEETSQWKEDGAVLPAEGQVKSCSTSQNRQGCASSAGFPVHWLPLPQWTILQASSPACLGKVQNEAEEICLPLQRSDEDSRHQH